MDTEEKLKDERALAERAHEQRYEGMKLHADHVLSYSNASMKAPALASVGGIAALLGFYSANYKRFSDQPDVLLNFNSILFWLLLSVMFTVIAPGLAYFSQFFYTFSLEEETYHYDRPFVRDTKKSKCYERIGNIFRILTVLVVLSSICCLIRGGYIFLLLFK